MLSSPIPIRNSIPSRNTTLSDLPSLGAELDLIQKRSTFSGVDPKIVRPLTTGQKGTIIAMKKPRKKPTLLVPLKSSDSEQNSQRSPRKTVKILAELPELVQFGPISLEDDDSYNLFLVDDFYEETGENSFFSFDSACSEGLSYCDSFNCFS